MLDILAEFIIELIQGRDQKKKQAQRRQGNLQPRTAPPPQQGRGHWPERSASDPYVQDHPSDLEYGRDAGQTLTIGEVMRRMHEKAMRGGGDAPVLDPQFYPAQQVAPSPVYDTYERGASSQVSPQPPPPQSHAQPSQGGYTPLSGKRVQSAFQLEEEAAANALGRKRGKQGLDFVAKLRSNPAAAREAFVFSEIFGKPLGERM